MFRTALVRCSVHCSDDKSQIGFSLSIVRVGHGVECRWLEALIIGVVGVYAQYMASYKELDILDDQQRYNKVTTVRSGT